MYLVIMCVLSDSVYVSLYVVYILILDDCWTRGEASLCCTRIIQGVSLHGVLGGLAIIAC